MIPKPIPNLIDDSTRVRIPGRIALHAPSEQLGVEVVVVHS